MQYFGFEAVVPLEFTNLYISNWLITFCMADLVVKSAVKEALSDKNVASDFYEALDEEVHELIDEAAERAAANDRKTVQPRDL